MGIKHNKAHLLWEAPSEDLEVVSFSLEDHISEPHFMKLLVKSESPDISFEKMLYANAKITLAAGPELAAKRYFGGVITRFSHVRTGHGNLETANPKAFFYQVEIRSPLWPLTREITSKVYQDLTSEDIVKELLGNHQIEADWQLNAPPKIRPYCIQYRETTFDFICRLLEDDGIYYFFDHKAGKVVFADHPGAHSPCPITDSAVYMEDYSPMLFSGMQEIVQKLRYEEQIDVGTFAFRDYNYETSQIDLTVNESLGESPNYPKLHYYQHETTHTDADTGDAVKKRRMEEIQVQQKWIEGYGFCRAFATGFSFSISDHYRKKVNETRWLLAGLSIEAEQGLFRCHFKAVPVDTQYRPLRKTPTPKIFAVQTATVVGPGGAQVYLDDMGRCKLQFHWDREGPKNDQSSIWLRVSNGYAGKDYGIQWIPRIGHEVLVSFIDGNPDRPVVTGRVYNDFNTAPLGPAEKYQNIIKTIKDNHILFDDDDGKERVNIRAQKDMNTLVVNDKNTHVGNDNVQVIKKNRTVVVQEEDYLEKIEKGNYTRITKKDDASVVEDGDRKLNVEKGNWISKVKGNTELTLTNGSHIVKVETGGQTTNVKADKKTTVKGQYTINVDGDYTVNPKGAAFNAKGNGFKAKSDAHILLDGTTDITITCPAGVNLDSGASKISLSPGQISLSNGPSSIKITPAGIEISGPLVTLKGLIKHNC